MICFAFPDGSPSKCLRRSAGRRTPSTTWSSALRWPKRFETQNVRGVGFSYLGEHAICKTCGNEIYIAELNDVNARAREDAYAKALMLQNGINLKTVDPRPREAIVLEFNLDKLTMNEVAYIAKRVREHFPNNKVLAIPNGVSLYSLGKDVLENYISMVSEIIDEGDIS